MKSSYNLFLIFLMFGFKRNDTKNDIYILINNDIIKSEIVFKEFKDNSNRIRLYEFKYEMDQHSEKFLSECEFDSSLVILRGKAIPRNFKYAPLITIKNSNNSKIKLKIDKTVLPCWIKINDSFFRNIKTSNLHFNSNIDTTRLTIFIDNDKMNSVKDIKITKGAIVKIQSQRNSFRGDLRPDIEKLKYGFFKGDTLILLSPKGLIYKYLKK